MSAGEDDSKSTAEDTTKESDNDKSKEWPPLNNHLIEPVKAEGKMKRIDAIVPAERLSNVNDALKKAGVGGMTVFDSKGRGQVPIQQRSAGRGGVFTPEFNTNCSIMVVVKDSDVDKVVNAIVQGASTGLAGEGKVFVTSVHDAVDIGSKKRGEQAL